jgi:hypothetical protein
LQSNARKALDDAVEPSELFQGGVSFATDADARKQILDALNQL